MQGEANPCGSFEVFEVAPGVKRNGTGGNGECGEYGKKESLIG